eukprot:scaffold7340_cov266-Pinguiococcus_pyrenoidosus.AAC.61
MRRAVHHRRRRPLLHARRGRAVGAWSFSLGLLRLCWRGVSGLPADAAPASEDSLAGGHAAGESGAILRAVAAGALHADEHLPHVPLHPAADPQRGHFRLWWTPPLRVRDAGDGSGDLCGRRGGSSRLGWLVEDSLENLSCAYRAVAPHPVVEHGAAVRC